MISSSAFNHYNKGVFCILLGTLCFASKGIIIKLAYQQGIGAMPLLMLRMLFALPFYAGVALWLNFQPGKFLTRNEKVKIVGLGLLGYYVSSLLDFWGLQYISAGLERLILYIYPTFVLLILAYWRGNILSFREKGAMLFAYFGMALVFIHDVRLTTAWHTTILGAALVFMSTITFAIFVVGAGTLIPRVGSLRFTAFGMLAACAGVTFHNLAATGIASIYQNTQVYQLALVLAFFCTVLPSFLMNEGLRIIGSGKAAMLGTFGPVVTLFLGYWILQEKITLIQLIGAGLVITGVAVSAIPKFPKNPHVTK